MSEEYQRVNNDDDDPAPVRHYSVNPDGVARLRSAVPSLPALPNLDFNDIDNAISRMQSRFSAPGSATSPTRPSQSSPSATSPNQAIPSPARHVSSRHRRGVSSADTVVGDNAVEGTGKDGYEYLKHNDEHEQFLVDSEDIANQHLYATQQHQQQQSGYLPTIHSGQTMLYQPQIFLPNSSPDFMYQTDPYGRPLSGIWDGSRPASVAFPYHTPAGSVGYAPTVYNVPVLSAYNPDTEYGSQSDLSHINYHTDPFLLPASDSRPRSPTSEMEYVRVEKDPEAGVPLTMTTPGTAALESPQVDTKHYGPAPVGKQIRRRKTKKKVPLTKGHLVLELPVPSRLLLPYKPEPEMTHTRYTAVTCDPDDFVKERFSLRQNSSGRQTELFIVITMYNENEILFCRTLYGIMKNISHLCQRKSSRIWGPESWKKVVVCIVADGRQKIHPRVLDCLTALGVYQGEYMKNEVNRQPVTAHMFEYTASFGLDPELHFKYPDKGIVPTQIIFILKERNQKKINSHRWFFNAYGPLLMPNICVLIDVGTRPGPKSLYYLWKAFDRNSNVGGACGEIAAYKGPMWRYLLNPLVAAQNFEYKMSNILDKTCESMFGYISVLPGAFSAYRYIALQNDKKGKGPLASYFKGETIHGVGSDIFTSNMYLAEDRILCFELVAKAKSNWVLKYVRNSVGETDVPDSLDELILQRRRWLNGSFFAAVYALAHFGQVLRAGHSFGRKCALTVEMVYNVINLVFAWFAIGNFFLFFVILTSSIEDPSFQLKGVEYVNLTTQSMYGTIVMAVFLFSMGNRPKAAKWKYQTSTILLGLLTIYMMACAVLCSLRAAEFIDTPLYRNMVFSVIITYGVYFASSMLALDPYHLVTCFAQYILLTPMYINVLNIYAFANLDDISWGTKQDHVVTNDLGTVVQDKHQQVDIEVVAELPNDHYMEALENLRTRKPLINPSTVRLISDAEKEQDARDYHANIRTNVLLMWALTNGLLVFTILSGGGGGQTFRGDGEGSKTRAYMAFVLAFVAITSIIRFLSSTLYHAVTLITG